jgi:hypothetical protein
VVRVTPEEPTKPTPRATGPSITLADAAGWVTLFSQMNFLSHPRSPRMMASGLSGGDVFKLRRAGKLGPKASAITLGGTRVELFWERAFFGGVRPWFVCPVCKARRRFLHLRDGHIACRKCVDLAYQSRHACWRSARPLRRAARLRRMIGADVHPFAEIPPKPRGWRTRPARSWESIVAEIAPCERETLGAIVPAYAALSRQKGTLP